MGQPIFVMGICAPAFVGNPDHIFHFITQSMRGDISVINRVIDVLLRPIEKDTELNEFMARTTDEKTAIAEQSIDSGESVN